MTARRSRRDFVKADRAAWRELRGRLPRPVFGTFAALFIEADHRTGFVRGSIRGIATELGDRRDTFTDHVRRLDAEGEVQIVAATNQYDGDQDAGIQIVRYAELTGEAAAMLARKPGHAGTVGGTVGGPETGPSDGRQPARTALRSQEVKK